MNDSQVLMLLRQLAEYIDEGDSINVAMNKTTGKRQMSEIAAAMRRHPLYVHILNDYMKKLGRGNRYQFNNKLNCIERLVR